MIKLGKTRIMLVFLILACLVDRVQAETWASEEEWNFEIGKKIIYIFEKD